MHLCDAGDGLDLLEELLFGSELALLPRAEGLNVKRRHHLEVEAPTAHHTLQLC